MKEFNKEEYNKLCAEFLGFEISENEECFKIPNKKGWVKLNIFHSDWNWIMEVVEKIESSDYWVCIQNTYIRFGKKHDESPFLSYSFSTIRTTKKEAVVQAIWEFLNWYKTRTT